MGFFQRCRSSRKSAPKPPIPPKHIAVKGLLRQVLDALLGAVAAGDVDAGVGVGDGFGFGFFGHCAAFCGQIMKRALRTGKVDSSRLGAPGL